MKSQITSDTVAWLVCFVAVAFYLPSTRWWSAQAFPQNLNRDTVIVATLAAICWVLLRVFFRGRAVKSESRALCLLVGVASPIAAWVVAWAIVWLALSAGNGWLGRFSFVPRIFTLAPLIIAGYGRGLASAVIYHRKS